MARFTLTKAQRKDLGSEYTAQPDIECGSDDDMGCYRCGRCLHECPIYVGGRLLDGGHCFECGAERLIDIAAR